jgi:hypothetical protein
MNPLWETDWARFGEVIIDKCVREVTSNIDGVLAGASFRALLGICRAGGYAYAQVLKQLIPILLLKLASLDTYVNEVFIAPHMSCGGSINLSS